MTQRHVVPADIAEQMFPQHHPDSYHPAYDFSPPSITWLVGPIDCEWCVGKGWVYGEPDHYERGTEASLECEHCDGLGYPPTVEIISLRKVSEISTNYKVHGVVRLGKPVPIVGSFCPEKTNEPQTAHLHVNEQESHLGFCRDGRDLIWESPWQTKNLVAIGPCSPGQVAYPIEVTS